jgi:hypothetical protein
MEQCGFGYAASGTSMIFACRKRRTRFFIEYAGVKT